jgi:uncharacterized protein (DUF2062 family)
MNPKRWLHEHSLRLLAIRDTPESIAGGIAIGIFFAFSPFFGLKELLTILFAWLTRANIIAAVLAVTAHNILLPLMPVIYREEYKIGYWMLSQPHQWPPALHKGPWESHTWRSWATIYKIGKDLLLGSMLCTTPAAILSYFISKEIVARHQKKKLATAAPETG